MKAREALEAVRTGDVPLDRYHRALALLTALVEEHEARLVWETTETKMDVLCKAIAITKQLEEEE